LATILQGLTNFGDGQLETTIKIASRDEFHLIACQSNQMASNLHKTMYELEELNSTLEEKVKERTAAYAHQKERAEKLLLNILPHSIAQTLQESPDKIIVDDYAQVSIIFSDFVGFTRISETVTPEKLVRELNEIFGELDEICEKFHVEKIKTIGDSYMAAAGLPERTDSHPVDAVSFALAICEVMERRLKNPENLPFRVRVGVHTGPVVAGVIGQRKFAYDLWGDTVNIASRLESYSKSGRVNISETTWRMVREQFDCIERGEIEVKGKGKMNMFFANPKKEKIHSET
jgi:class 3 adenylate cyclase